MKYGLFLIAAALTAACSTKPVPGVCCLGPDDCGRLGLSGDRPCLAGQACVDFQCVAASCSNQGCPAEEPICDVTTDACRGCQLDAECPSGACGDDGACVLEASIVYLAPTGPNVAPCSRSAPCSGLQFGIQQTSGTRNHVVMAPGTYMADSVTIQITPASTPASRIHIHGGGATLTDGHFEILIDIRIPTMVWDLDIKYESTAILALAETSLERVRIEAGDGIQASWLKARDVSFQTTGTAISVAGTLDLDRATIAGGTTGISASSQSSIQITNLLVHSTSDVALDLQGATGSVSFSTIANTGIGSTTASGISCLQFSGPAIRSSIVWTPGSLRPAITGGGCSLASVIAGPIGVVGAMNVNPLFVNPQVEDYHLSPNSPARDMVDSGPATDFEGDPRPRGARFDLGADETP